MLTIFGNKAFQSLKSTSFLDSSSRCSVAHTTSSRYHQASTTIICGFPIVVILGCTTWSPVDTLHVIASKARWFLRLIPPNSLPAYSCISRSRVSSLESWLANQTSRADAAGAAGTYPCRHCHRGSSAGSTWPARNCETSNFLQKLRNHGQFNAYNWKRPWPPLSETLGRFKSLNVKRFHSGSAIIAIGLCISNLLFELCQGWTAWDWSCLMCSPSDRKGGVPLWRLSFVSIAEIWDVSTMDTPNH